MVIGLGVDYKNVAHGVEGIENAEYVDEVPDAPIVNLDANFVIPEELRHQDLVFPRLLQMKAMLDVAENAGSLVTVSDISPERLEERPFRRPDFVAEWKMLKKAWSLRRNGRDKLSERKVTEGSDLYYSSDSLTDLNDWLWRFALRLGQPHYESFFSALMSEVQPLMQTPDFDSLMNYYDTISVDRGHRYFDLMKVYFEAFSEFGQTYFQVSMGLDISNGYAATSTNFDSVKMFYGKAFETFASSVDILAYFNNLIAGRAFDQFAQMTHDQFLKLDKASRFNPFSGNATFAAVCEEADNQIRNASHHESMRFDAQTQIISYRSGKGGIGPEQNISYANYLIGCTKLFLQCMVLFRLEIMVCHMSKRRLPI